MGFKKQRKPPLTHAQVMFYSTGMSLTIILWKQDLKSPEYQVCLGEISPPTPLPQPLTKAYYLG